MRKPGTLREIVERSPECFETPKALYIHIPFCRTRCSYCDFHSFDLSCLNPGLSASYTEALKSRLASLGKDMFSDIETIYIGGGTPTSLSDAEFASLVHSLGGLGTKKLREWTVEANPESLSPEKIRILQDSGVTRISLGIQSLDEGELALLGRRGTTDQCKRALHLAQKSGLAVSADLISGLPIRAEGGKSFLAESTRFLIAEGIPHISVYDLTLEEGTLLAARIASGELRAMDEDAAFEERKAVENLLKSAGYMRYEVSNFALAGAMSRHNSIYWEMRSYLGLGSGAVSTLVSSERAIREGLPAGLRISETKDLDTFRSRPDEGMELEVLSARTSAFETIMMGLRTARGVDSGRFEGRFGLSPEALFPATIKKWHSHFTCGEDFISLDDEGMDILNSILVDIGTEIDSVPDFQKGGRA